jgi:hypothetical protein
MADPLVEADSRVDVIHRLRSVTGEFLPQLLTYVAVGELIIEEVPQAMAGELPSAAAAGSGTFTHDGRINVRHVHQFCKQL